MPSESGRRGVRWSVALMVAGSGVVVGCSTMGEDGKDKKVWSGVSFVQSTRVEPSPSPAAAPGFDAERVWSGFDDWEPALAVDPNSSWVYQMTTRYSGPKACNGCPFPVIVFRSSSDGGATWGADRFIPISKNPQNDPMIEVATDGTIYAGWLDDYTPGVKFMKSSDHGQTWSTPFQFTEPKEDPAMVGPAGTGDLCGRPGCLHGLQCLATASSPPRTTSALPGDPTSRPTTTPATGSKRVGPSLPTGTSTSSPPISRRTTPATLS